MNDRLGRYSQSERCKRPFEGCKLSVVNLAPKHFGGIKSKMATNLSGEQILSAIEQLSSAELERLVPRVIALRASRRAPQLAPNESKLLARIEQPLPESLKARLAELELKRDDLLLTEAEHAELTALSDQAEKLHAERLAALVELAELRGTTLPALMAQLGIKFPENA